MKKTILFAVLLAIVAMPLAALAAAAPAATTGKWEFTLGGYVKLDSWWDAAGNNENMVWKAPRNNHPDYQHGRFAMTANNSRFNFAIKGPKLFGAQVTGFIEMDFGANSAAQTWALGGDTPDGGNFRMRHAFVRLNWAETELLLGQYFSFFSEFYPESANDGGAHYRGTFVYRPAQIRLTQKFLGDWEVAGLIATPRQITNPDANSINPGENSESPHLEAKLKFEKDFYGKAAYYGRPRGFVAQVAGFWQRLRYRNNAGIAAGTNTWGSGQYQTLGAFFPGAIANIPQGIGQQYISAWGVNATLFIPIIPTTSANLAGTASLLTQWSVGQGLSSVVGAWFNDDSYLIFDSRVGNNNNYKRILTPQFAGFVQGQYYFNNEWFMSVSWAHMHKFGVNYNEKNLNCATIANPEGYAMALGTGLNLATGATDMVKWSNQICATLWYRPITAIKFGLMYAYTVDKYFQQIGATGAANNVQGVNVTDIGQSHRVQFATFFFF